MKTFRIRIHKGRAGLLMAWSPDKWGFNAIERTREDLERVAPRLLEEILKLEGRPGPVKLIWQD